MEDVITDYLTGPVASTTTGLGTVEDLLQTMT